MPQTGKTRIATPQTRSPTEQKRPACPSHPHATAQPSNIAGGAPGHLSNPLCARRRGPIARCALACGAMPPHDAKRRGCSPPRDQPARSACSTPRRAAPHRTSSGHWHQRPPPKRARRRELRGVSCVGTAHMMRRRSNPWRRRTSAVPPPVHAGRAAPRRADRPLSTGARARARADCGVRARALATAPRIAPS